MLKLKLQYFGHLMWRTDSLEKTLMLGKIEGGRRRGLRRMKLLDGIANSMDMNLSKFESWGWTGRPGLMQSMTSQRVRHEWATELNWVTDFLSFGSRITVDSDYSHEIKRHLIIGRKTMTNLDSILKKQRHHFVDKGLYSQSYGFSSHRIQMWVLDHKEGWALKN